MGQDKKNLLKQIYDGRFFPAENIVSKDPEYTALRRKSDEEIKYLAGKLDEESRGRLDELISMIHQAEYLHGYANFDYGFRAGIALARELSEPTTN